VAFRPGRDRTQQVVNHTDEPVRVLICSTNELPEIAEHVETGVTVLLTDNGAERVPPGAAQELTQP